MAVMPRRYRFSVDEYDRMAQVGLLTECDRVELLDGDIVEMSPIGDRHASVVGRISNAFWQQCSGRALVWVQNPVGLRPVRSVPQPDVMLLRSKPDFYASGRPTMDDVLLLVEVMDSSVETDRGIKLPLYARAAIVETWLVDLTTDRVCVFRRPSATGYAETHVAARGDRVAPAVFPDTPLAVEDLIG